jgi:tryptophanyl-tRNA synthetase
MKKVLSCIQPTGEMHLGNYFGAVKNWVDLQSKYECLYGIVDYHAMTMPYDTKKLRQNTWNLIMDLVAVGINPDNIFIQSLVPEHAELSWIFNCFCSYGQLTRMTQFKDKSQGDQVKGENFISAGLLDYPVLQAADILIYKADYVPVGKDQEQHLELTRDIAQRFNHSVGKEYFVLPEPLYTDTPKIKSTADPSRKMSKSAGQKHYLSVFGDEARIRKQIKSAVTDIGSQPTQEMSPGVSNLFELLKATGDLSSYNTLREAYNDDKLRYAELKEAVSNSIVEMIAPFNQRRIEIAQDKRKLKDQIKASSHRIRMHAHETVKEVKDLVGLMNIKI